MAQLGPNVKIQVQNGTGTNPAVAKVMSSSPIDQVTSSLCNSDQATNSSHVTRDHARDPTTITLDDSIEILGIKPPTRPTPIPRKKQIQLPVHRILMMPKNHRYLHPKYQPLVKLRSYSSKMIQRLLAGGSLVVKGRNKPSTVSTKGVTDAAFTKAKLGTSAPPPWMPSFFSQSYPPPFASHVATTPQSTFSETQLASKCCPVCMARYADVEVLRSHIKTEHHVEPFGYVVMDGDGAPTNFVPFETPAPTTPEATKPGAHNVGVGSALDAEGKRQAACLDSSSDESDAEDPRLNIDSMRKRKKRLTKRRTHDARLKRARNASSSSSSSTPNLSILSDADPENSADDAVSPRPSPSKTSDFYPPGTTFTCTVCNETLKDVSKFHAHARLAHSIRRERRGGVSCIVSDPLSGKTEFVKLKSAPFSPTKSPPAPVPTHTFTCSICCEVFKDVDFIRMHIKRQHRASKISFFKNDVKTGGVEVITETDTGTIADYR